MLRRRLEDCIGLDWIDLGGVEVFRLAFGLDESSFSMLARICSNNMIIEAIKPVSRLGSVEKKSDDY